MTLKHPSDRTVIKLRVRNVVHYSFPFVQVHWKSNSAKTFCFLLVVLYILPHFKLLSKHTPNSFLHLELLIVVPNFRYLFLLVYFLSLWLTFSKVCFDLLSSNHVKNCSAILLIRLKALKNWQNNYFQGNQINYKGKC